MIDHKSKQSRAAAETVAVDQWSEISYFAWKRRLGMSPPAHATKSAAAHTA